MTGSAVPWIAWVAGALYDDCMFSLWQSVVPLSILLKTLRGFAEVKPTWSSHGELWNADTRRYLRVAVRRRKLLLCQHRKPFQVRHFDLVQLSPGSISGTFVLKF
jgi:hypothetical protein